MSRKNIKRSITSPDELNKHLQYTSPTTWIILGVVILALVSLFAWSFIYKIQEKITGMASITNGEVTLIVSNVNRSKLAVGQKVYIADKVGEILSFNDDTPVISLFDLADNDYTYTIVVKELRPIDFLIK